VSTEPLSQVNFRFVLVGCRCVMSRYRLYRLARVAAVAFSVTLIFGIAAFAQERRQGEPGQFD